MATKKTKLSDVVAEKAKSENVDMQIHISDEERQHLVECFMELHFNAPSLELVEKMRQRYDGIGLPQDVVTMHLLYHGAINQVIHTALEHKIADEAQKAKTAVRVKKPRKQ